MRLGAEAPPNTALTQEGKDLLETMRFRIFKGRLGVTTREEINWAVTTMKKYTSEPWILLRPSGEAPSADDLRLELNRVYAWIPSEARIFVEGGNEPNQYYPNNPTLGTRWQFGNNLDTQLTNYRQWLKSILALRKEYGRVKWVAPGLMPGGDADKWMVEERDQFDYDGIHVYESYQVHSRFKLPLIATEIGVPFLIAQFLSKAGVQAACRFILPWSNMGEWESYKVTNEQAQQYAELNKEKPMPPDYQKLAHEVVDQAYMDSAGEGFNPDTAFREYTSAGMPQGPIRHTTLISYQAHALGVLVVPFATPLPGLVRLFSPGKSGEDMLAAYLESLAKKA